VQIGRDGVQAVDGEPADLVGSDVVGAGPGQGRLGRRGVQRHRTEAEQCDAAPFDASAVVQRDGDGRAGKGEVPAAAGEFRNGEATPSQPGREEDAGQNGAGAEPEGVAPVVRPAQPDVAQVHQVFGEGQAQGEHGYEALTARDDLRARCS